MKVNFYATYRPIVGGKTIDFDVDHGITVQQLVEAGLAEEFEASDAEGRTVRAIRTRTRLVDETPPGAE